MKSRGQAPNTALQTSRRAAFTLIEVVIALAVLGTMASGCYIGFNAINAYGVSSRLYSEAQTAAQNQIDLILSKEPFDVTGAYISGAFNVNLNKVPAELMTTAELDALAGVVPFPTGPSSMPATTSAYYPYYPYYRSGNGTPLTKQAFVYTDPVTGKVLVTGAMTSVIQDTAWTMTYVGVSNTPKPLNIRKATVTVAYNFRGRDYTVSMDTLRTADQ